MITPEAIISDADGTLVDTLHLIRHGQYEAAKTYLAKKGIDPAEVPSYENYEFLLNQTVGGSARDTLEKTVRLLYADNPQQLSGLNFDDLHDLLKPVQDRIAPEFVKAYDGLPRFLAEIGQHGIKLAVFSSGTRHMVVRNFGVALPQLGLTNLYKSANVSEMEKLRQFEDAVKKYFSIPEFTVITCEDVNTHKPDPASLNLAMKRLNVAADKSIVFGDHAVDMQAGMNASVPIRIGVTHGFDDDETLLGAGATQIVHSLDELTNQLG